MRDAERLDVEIHLDELELSGYVVLSEHGAIMFPTKVEALEFQRQWRTLQGLDPNTGELVVAA